MTKQDFFLVVSVDLSTQRTPKHKNHAHVDGSMGLEQVSDSSKRSQHFYRSQKEFHRLAKAGFFTSMHCDWFS